MRQSLEGLSTRIEKFINLLEVRVERLHRLHSKLCHHTHARAPTQKSIISYRLDESVGQHLSRFSVCTPRREMLECMQVSREVKHCIPIFREIVPKEKFEICGCNTQTK